MDRPPPAAHVPGGDAALLDDPRGRAQRRRHLRAVPGPARTGALALVRAGPRGRSPHRGRGVGATGVPAGQVHLHRLLRLHRGGGRRALRQHVQQPEPAAASPPTAGRPAIAWKNSSWKPGIRCVTTQPTLSVLYDDKLPEEFLLKAVECVKTGAGYPAFMNNRVAMEFLLGQYGPRGDDPGGGARLSPSAAASRPRRCAWKPLAAATVAASTSSPAAPASPPASASTSSRCPRSWSWCFLTAWTSAPALRVFPAHGRRSEPPTTSSSTSSRLYFAQAVEVLCAHQQHPARHLAQEQHGRLQLAAQTRLPGPRPPDQRAGLPLQRHLQRGDLRHGQPGQQPGRAQEAGLRGQGRDAWTRCGGAAWTTSASRRADEVGSYSLADQEKRDGTDADAYDRAPLSAACTAPKYGNDDPAVDSILAEWEDVVLRHVPRLRVAQRHAALPLPDLRLHPRADGRRHDRHAGRPPWPAPPSPTPPCRPTPAPTATAPTRCLPRPPVWDHSRSQNSQLNLKIHPSAVRGIEGAQQAARTDPGLHAQGRVPHPVQRGGFAGRCATRSASRGNYRDLMVRVAGFTQYWVEIGKPIQDEVIARTEYEGV